MTVVLYVAAAWVAISVPVALVLGRAMARADRLAPDVPLAVVIPIRRAS